MGHDRKRDQDPRRVFEDGTGKQAGSRFDQTVPGEIIDYSSLEPFALYRLYKNGDERAFTAIYQRFCTGIFSYCVRVLSDFHYAEDVLVETFTKLARSNLREQGSLKAWLFRVATNHCYRVFRKHGKEIEFNEDRCRADVRDHGPGLIRKMKIQKMLSELPENQRIVMVMKFYENLTYAEIAEVLCCPLGTVKSRIHEGISHLRRRFHGLYRHEEALR